MPLMSRKAPLIVGLALALGAGTAAAQDQGVKVRGLVSLGFVGGGESLASAQVNTVGGGSTTTNVYAGGTVDIRGGVEFGFTPQWSTQLSLGYATGGVNADNGKINFTSFPVEALGHFRFHPSWRVGLGLRAPQNAKYREGGAAGNGAADFNSSVAPVVELEWMASSALGLKLRGMKEKYTVKGTSIKVDGSTWGLTGTFYF